MLSRMNMIADIETLYARLGERDYEAVMSYLADDIVWVVASSVSGRIIPRVKVSEILHAVRDRDREPRSQFSAYARDLPGCVATGATLEEVNSEIDRASTARYTLERR